MSPKSAYRFNPSRLYLYPLLLGLALIGFCLLVWYFPRILLFLVLFPILITGFGLVLYGLDLWRNVPNWRDCCTRARTRFWPREDDRR